MSTAPEPASEQVQVQSRAARQQANTNHLWDKAASPSPTGGTAGTSGDSAKGLQKATCAWERKQPVWPRQSLNIHSLFLLCPS